MEASPPPKPPEFALGLGDLPFEDVAEREALDLLGHHSDPKPRHYDPAVPRRRTPLHERERLCHERPGAVLRGPPIAATCACGEKRDLP